MFAIAALPKSLRPPSHGAWFIRRLLAAAVALPLTACSVGPKYQRPSAPIPAAYKETPPENQKEAGEWKPAAPSDATPRGKWWTVYNDPELNALEEQVSISNQNILAAEAQFRAARDAVRIARSGLFPTVSVSPSIVSSRAALTGTAGVQNFKPSSRTAFNLPVDLSYQADLWGSIHSSKIISSCAAPTPTATCWTGRSSRTKFISN